MHLTAEQAAGFIDGILTPAARDAAAAHLAECAECQDELIACARLTHRAVPSVRRTGWRRAGAVGGAGALAAAALLLVVLPDRPRAPDRPVVPSTVERAATSGSPSPSGSEPLVALGPTDGAQVTMDSMMLVWRPASPGASYRVTLTDATGAVLWTGETADTVVVPRPARPLAGGRTLYWFVDALDPDGGTRTTGARRLVVTP